MCTEFSEIFQMHVNIVYTRFWLSIINYREMDIQYYLFLTNGIQNVKKDITVIRKKNVEMITGIL